MPYDYIDGIPQDSNREPPTDRALHGPARAMYDGITVRCRPHINQHSCGIPYGENVEEWPPIEDWDQEED